MTDGGSDADTNDQSSSDTADESDTDTTSQSLTESTDQQTGDAAEQSDTDTHSDASSETIVDEVTDILSEEGHDVFQGREQILVRKSGHIAPNSVVYDKYLQDAEGVVLSYYKYTQTITIVPVPNDIDKRSVRTISGNGNSTYHVNATKFLEANGIAPEHTVRYEPTWNEELTGESPPGALQIDLRNDGEKVHSPSKYLSTDADKK